MGKIRRGGYVFITWIGDHAPRHVHIIRNGRTVAKWNLERDCIIEGKVTKHLLKIIKQLSVEGRL